ncbi:MAG: biopolymer transporter ExbD [Planctomycetaceae bacterium]|nr:MAG: biopolymer transporter ExbD [Planctomycetaceae bacterium]
MPQAMFGGDDPFLKKRRSMDGEVDITPMIDCTFLLLIFFMVTSTMQGGKELDLPAAVNSLGVNTEGAAIITIYAPDAEQPPKIIVENFDTKQNTEVDLTGAKTFIAQAVANGRQKIVVKAEGDVPHRVVDEVARLVGEVEGAEFYVGVSDKPEN